MRSSKVMHAGFAAVGLLVVGCTTSQDEMDQGVPTVGMPSDVEAESLESLLTQFERAASQQDLETLDTLAGLIRAHPDMPAVLVSKLGLVRAQQGRAEFNRRSYALAIANFVAAIALLSDESAAEPLFFLALSYGLTEQWPEAADTLARLAQVDPAGFDRFPMQPVFEIRRGLSEDGHHAQYQALIALLGEEYEPHPPNELPVPPDYYRWEYARQLAEAGETTRALEVLEGVILPSLRIDALTSRAFASLWDDDTFNALMDPIEGAEAQLARYEVRRARYPNYLEPVFEIMFALDELGRGEEAAQIGATYLDRIAAGETFEDSYRNTVWVYDTYAIILNNLGRTQLADAVYAEAVQLNESGGPNVSQTINQAISLLRRGQSDDALAQLETLDRNFTSPTGLMFAWQVEACAAHQKGEFQLRDTIAAQMEANWRDQPGALQSYLACAGDTEAGAAHMIRRLEDEFFAAGALGDLQIYDDLARNPDFALGLSWDDAISALGEREDVQAAVEPVGRILRFNISGGEWGEP